MKIKNLLVLLLVFVIFLISGCEKEFDKYYKFEGNKETIYELLQEKGEYNLFLEALDAAGYGEIIAKSGLFTVLAVKDEAFNTYLNSNGYSKIGDIPEDELKALVGYHVIDWLYSSSGLGTGYSSEKVPVDPLMVRKLTRFVPTHYSEIDVETGMEHIIVSENKLMSFFSEDYIEAMGISSADVTDFFPELNADLNQGDIIASDAVIVEKDMGAFNGWVHEVSIVLQPFRNHRDVLETDEQYSFYTDLAKMFSVHEFNQAYTDKLKIDMDGNGDYDSVFVQKWFNFNREYVGANSVTITGNKDMINVQKSFVTSFIPNNPALSQFFSEYYPDIPQDEIKELLPIPVIRSIVESCVFEGTAYFPSSVASGQLNTSYSIPYVVPESDINRKEMLSNGLFYEVNKFRVPDEFNALTKLFMTDTTYSHMLVALQDARLFGLLTSENIDYTVFVLKNSAFREIGYFLNEKQDGFVDEDGKNTSTSFLKKSLINHISFGKTDISSLGNLFFMRTINSDERYIKIFENTVSTDGIDKANLLDNGNEIANGLIYEVDNFMVSPDIGFFDYLKGTSKFSLFYDKLVEAEILFPDSKHILFNEGKMTCFAPTNDALADVTFPEDSKELKEYISRFFVKKVIFSDGQKQGNFETFGIDETQETRAYLNINVAVNNGTITVTNNSTETSVDVSDVTGDVMLDDGTLHTIDSIY